MAKLDEGDRMSIISLADRGHASRKIARMLGVTEGAVRYHLRRHREGATDGRARQTHLAATHAEAITHWMQRGGPKRNVAALHEHLVDEHGYTGSLRSVQRYVQAAFPKPTRRARRRVETPPGAQAQADWSVWPRIWVAGHRQRLYAFELQLSYSRYAVRVWSPRKDQLAWHHVHNEGFRRLGGVPATVRVDNEKTAVSHGAGAWGIVNEAYRRYARVVRFHVDACPPREPWTKGKIERRVRDHRGRVSPRSRHWESLEELQAWTDDQQARVARRRRCSRTGTSVLEAYEAERPQLAPLPILPEPFDVVITRTVSWDCLASFEGRRYSVPFRYAGRPVEVRGCAGRVQILADAAVVAVHPRHTAERLVLDPQHYEGPDTDHVRAPTPLGKMGRRLTEIAAMAPEARPVDLYAALAEVAR